MHYVCLVYFEERRLRGLSPAEKQTLDRESLAYDRELEAKGHLVIAHALEPASAAVTLQVRDGRMSSTDGPFRETKEVLGGFIVVEARDLNQAMQLAAGIPLAKLGRIEVRPTLSFDA
jgi:hypothetical protein